MCSTRSAAAAAEVSAPRLPMSARNHPSALTPGQAASEQARLESNPSLVARGRDRRTTDEQTTARNKRAPTCRRRRRRRLSERRNMKFDNDNSSSRRLLHLNSFTRLSRGAIVTSAVHQLYPAATAAAGFIGAPCERICRCPFISGLRGAALGSRCGHVRGLKSLIHLARESSA